MAWSNNSDTGLVLSFILGSSLLVWWLVPLWELVRFCWWVRCLLVVVCVGISDFLRKEDEPKPERLARCALGRTCTVASSPSEFVRPHKHFSRATPPAGPESGSRLRVHVVCYCKFFSLMLSLLTVVAIKHRIVLVK